MTILATLAFVEVSFSEFNSFLIILLFIYRLLFLLKVLNANLRSCSVNLSMQSWSQDPLSRSWSSSQNNNNNNNNPICKAPECQKTSVALADRNSRANYSPVGERTTVCFTSGAGANCQVLGLGFEIQCYGLRAICQKRNQYCRDTLDQQ